MRAKGDYDGWVWSWEDLPETAAYVERLPEGLRSYPGCIIRGTQTRPTIEELRDRVDPRALPPELRWPLQHPPTPNQWVPEVPFAALILALREIAFDSDEAFLDWAGGALRRILGSTLYRLILVMATPDRLAQRAPSAWDTLRRGTRRSISERGANHNFGHLSFPAHLFSPLHAEVVGRGLQVTYELSRARAPRARVLHYTPTGFDLEVTYDVSRLADGGSEASRRVMSVQR